MKNSLRMLLSWKTRDMVFLSMWTAMFLSCFFAFTILGTLALSFGIGLVTWEVVKCAPSISTTSAFGIARMVSITILILSPLMMIENPLTFDRGIILGYVSTAGACLGLFYLGLLVEPTWHTLRRLSKHSHVIVCC